MSSGIVEDEPVQGRPAQGFTGAILRIWKGAFTDPGDWLSLGADALAGDSGRAIGDAEQGDLMA